MLEPAQAASRQVAWLLLAALTVPAVGDYVSMYDIFSLTEGTPQALARNPVILQSYYIPAKQLNQ